MDIQHSIIINVLVSFSQIPYWKSRFTNLKLFMKNPSRETFIEHLRDALKNLYNFEYLRTSPLTELFNLKDRFNSSLTLQQLLIDSINNFKPSSDEPDQSHAWRFFNSLFCCYVQQLKQQIVADQLSISPRQLRREQRMALEALADFLWNQYNLETAQSFDNHPPDIGHVENPEFVKELGWVQELQPSNPTSLEDVLVSVLSVTEPLRRDQGLIIKNQISEDLPPLAIHDVVLTQILVNLISAAINRAPEGVVTISTERKGWVVDVSILTPQDKPTPPLAIGGNISLAIELSKLSSIELGFTENESVAFCANLLLPIQEQVPVLLVDDNEDALELFHRYTAGSRYRLISTQDPKDILSLAKKTNPQLIILDIMMPETNGWMILGMLKNHPLTTDIPIIVCTILPQEALALSLGASGFINKPINRQDFLRSLNLHVFSEMGAEPC